MRDFKNIDRLFQENLKDYEVFPPHKSWSTIDKRLNSTTKSRRLPFWLKISSIAALLMLFFSVGTIYFIPQNNFTKNFLPKKNNNNLNSSTNNDTLKSISTTSEIKNDSENVSKGKLIQLNSNQEISEQNIANNENVVVDNSTVEKKTSKTFNLSESKNLTYRSLNEQETISPKAAESKFTVATIFAPIYFNSFGDGSGADSQFNNNQTSGSSSYSYGVKFAYQLNNKFSVQSGINMINLGHTTNNVYLTPGTAIVDFSNISSNPILAKDNPNLSKQSIDLANENTANLNQVFGYIEIPVELKYNVTDGKLGVNLVGGFSTLVLNKDEVFVETNTFSQSLGNSNNLRPLNFSGNFGVDIDYSLYKNIYINVSPMFKVQTNTFSKNSGSIQSYYLGVYTGLNYKF